MSKNFFARDTRRVAQDLLGMELVRTIGKKKISAVIVETEAYKGFNDRASHASRGRTKRTEPMFGPPGTLYVYLIYGMYWCLNIVTEREEYPAAVLIRGLRLLPEDKLISGPGRVTRILHITNFFNAKNIFTNSRLSLGKRLLAPRKIQRTPRIGVGYAGEWAGKRWRYLIK